MWKRNLRSPLSTLLRRPLPSLSPLYTRSAAPTHPPTISPSFASLCNNQEITADFLFHRFYYPQNLTLSWKNFSSGIVANQCWNCTAVAQTVPFLVCQNCRCVQPVDPSVDYFQIFGLEKQYEIKEDNLGHTYKNWQKKLHPDLVHSKSEKEKEFAAEQSARIIDAYHTLGDPLSRAIYILKLEGVDVDEEETISEPELLTEILEIREAVEEAPDTQALRQLQTQIQEKLPHWSQSFATAFQSRNYEEARASIRRMIYYKRVNEEIVKKL